ncbi:CYTH domain-containing protein [candidate division KSB1 bacterium]|nr:CYTH domain-containing protein [candidate division KSB1 bacterium]
MAQEIERKFLTKSDAWRSNAIGRFYRQGYLSTVKERTVRIRTIRNEGYITVKGIAKGAARAEYEYEIPVKDANEMLDTLCEQPIIEKMRYEIEHNELIWLVDEFEGVNKGLILVEVELSDENQKIVLPDWVGAEVTGDPNYFNSNLTRNPYLGWGKKQ